MYEKIVKKFFVGNFARNPKMYNFFFSIFFDVNMTSYRRHFGPFLPFWAIKKQKCRFGAQNTKCVKNRQNVFCRKFLRGIQKCIIFFTKNDFDVAMTPKWRQFGNFPPFLPKYLKTRYLYGLKTFTCITYFFVRNILSLNSSFYGKRIRF